MRALAGFVAVAAGAYLALLAFLFFVQRSLLYFPDASDMEAARARLPGVERLTLATDDGESIVAWWRPPPADGPVFLYLHGNAANLAARQTRLAALAQEGWGFLAVSYRGYGGSSGVPTEAGLIADAEAAYAQLIASGASPRRIFLLGESLGTGVAIALAAKRDVAGVVLEAPFSSTVDIAREGFWFVPVGLLMRDQFRSAERVKAVRAPLLLVHGDADGVIPIRFGEKLFAAADGPKEMLRMPGAGHEPLDHPLARRRLADWVREVLTPR